MIYFNDDSTERRKALARAAMDRAERLAPDSPAVRAAAGFYDYRVEEDFHRALEEFDIALRSQPGNTDVLTGIGYVRRRIGAWDQSLEILKRAFQLDPRSGDIANSIAETYAALREWHVAAEYFDRAITLAPDQPRFWAARTMNELNRSGDIGAAREILRQAPNLDDPHLLPTRMTLDLYEGRYEAALDRESAGDLEHLGVFHRAGVYLMAALAHELLGQEEDARREADRSRVLLEESLREHPRYQYVRSRLALTYAFLGRNEAAIELGRLAAEAQAEDAFSGPRFVEELARIYVRTGQLELALGLLDTLMSTPYQQALGPTDLRLDPIWAPLRDDPGFRSLSRSFT
jgi:serine/threonine-protein kinase